MSEAIPANNTDGRAFIKVLIPQSHDILVEQIPGNETIDQNKAQPRWTMRITPTTAGKRR